MAKGDKEGGMLFDLRGKRRNVIKVVYAVLALLMGASLILLAGPIGFGGGGGGGDAAELSEERAERIEQRLVEEPGNPNLLLNLTRAQIATANALSEVNPATGAAVLTVESRQELERASATWSEYLEVTDEPAPGGAQLVANALFSLAENSASTVEARNNVAAAAEAQQIVAEERPSVGSLSTLSLYMLYAGEFEAAEEVLEESKKLANTKFERRQLQNQFDQVEDQAREFEKQFNEARQAAREGTAGGEGEGAQNPFNLGGVSE